MAFTIQDFVKGLDFTGLSPITGADLNVLVDSAVAANDRGILLWSEDTALNTPDVPDAQATQKFQRNLWVRLPHATAPDTTPIVYSWDPNLASDPVYKKWVETNADIAALEVDIAAAQADATLALTTANSFNTAINNATNRANEAWNKADAAEDTADSLAGSVTTATEAAETASAAAATAQTQADTALAAANAKKDVNAALNPGTAGQLIRTNSSANGVEWFTQSSNYARFSETQNKNVDAGASVIGSNVRILNTTDNAASFATLEASGKITLTAGTYKIRGWSQGFLNDNYGSQLFIIKDSDVSVLLQGLSIYCNDAGPFHSHVEGIITLAATTTIRLADYRSGARATDGLGKAANVAPTGGKEVYASLEIIKL